MGEYWHRSSTSPSKVTVPIFQQGGWFDPYSGSHLRSFAAIGERVSNRVMIGPWSHEEEIDSFRGDVDLSASHTVIRDHELVFYNRYLKDEGNDWEERPRGGALRARREPLARRPTSGRCRARRTRRGTCARAASSPRMPPGGDEQADRYDYDPADPVPTIGGVNSVLTMTQGAQTPVRPGPIDQRPLEARDDVLVYTSDKLHHDLDVIGPVEMVLYAASRARDTDWIVRLCDVLPRRQVDLRHRGHHPRALPQLERGRLDRAARAGRGRPSTASAATRWRTASRRAIASAST